MSQQSEILNFDTFLDRFLEINHISPSTELNEKIINEAIIFSQDSHAATIDNIINSFSEEAAVIDNEIEDIKNLINEIEDIKNLIKNQKTSIAKGELNQENADLDTQIKLITEVALVSKNLALLNIEKENLDLQIKLIKGQYKITQPVAEIETNKVNNKQHIIISIGAFLGFIFSIFIVLFRQAYLKEKN
jgi:hypothetical protein